MSKKQYLNLELLKREYRNRGKALRGYKILNNLITSNDEIQLSIFLRFHRHSAITTEEEVHVRDAVDILFRYYSIIQVAVISGFVSQSLDNNLNKEILKILGNFAVKKYYKEFYPLVLPQILYESVQLITEQTHQKSPENSTLFDEFILLDNYMQNDKDILTFLWFLDEGGTIDKDNTIYNIKSVLNLITQI